MLSNFPQLALLILPPVVGGVAVALFLAEQFFPTRPLKERLKVNLGVTAIAVVVNFALVQTAAYFAIQTSEHHHFGLVRWLPMSPLLAGLVAFLLLDLTVYYWHRANHLSSFLWRFHNAHHIDPDLDVSRGFRFHFGEMILSTTDNPEVLGKEQSQWANLKETGG